jgi:hypothetical protein
MQLVIKFFLIIFLTLEIKTTVFGSGPLESEGEAIPPTLASPVSSSSASSSAVAATPENKTPPTIFRIWKNSTEIVAYSHDAERKKIDWRQPITWSQQEKEFVGRMATLNGQAYKAKDCPKNVVLTRMGLIVRTPSGGYTYHEFLIPFIYISGLDLSAYPSFLSKKADKLSIEAWEKFYKAVQEDKFVRENSMELGYMGALFREKTPALSSLLRQAGEWDEIIGKRQDAREFWGELYDQMLAKVSLNFKNYRDKDLSVKIKEHLSSLFGVLIRKRLHFGNLLAENILHIKDSSLPHLRTLMPASSPAKIGVEVKAAQELERMKPLVKEMKSDNREILINGLDEISIKMLIEAYTLSYQNNFLDAEQASTFVIASNHPKVSEAMKKSTPPLAPSSVATPSSSASSIIPEEVILPSLGSVVTIVISHLSLRSTCNFYLAAKAEKDPRKKEELEAQLGCTESLAFLAGTKPTYLFPLIESQKSMLREKGYEVDHNFNCLIIANSLYHDKYIELEGKDIDEQAPPPDNIIPLLPPGKYYPAIYHGIPQNRALAGIPKPKKNEGKK